LGEFQALCECALHLTVFHNHSKVDKLTKMVAQTIKQGLHKFGLQKGLSHGLGLSTPMIGHVVYIGLINKLHWHHFPLISFCLVMS